MDKTKLEKRPKKDIPVQIRIDKNQSEFMRKNSYSPTAIFNEALKDLGYK